ncbi:MAG: DUF4412 domain-containing protein [Chitinophagales bacterium]
MSKRILYTACLSLFISLSAWAQGFYMEMKMSSTKQGEMGTMVVYSQNGNTRSEVKFAKQEMQMVGSMATLILSSNPKVIYMLNEKAKTYTEVDASSKEEYKDDDKAEYEVTLLGTEKVNGYNCKHIKVKRKGAKEGMEWWTTTEMTGYADYAKIKTQYTSKSNMIKAIDAAGAMGVAVRIKTGEGAEGMQIDLVKAEKRNNPDSLFSLAGYTKSGGASAPAFDPSKMKDMTPEERQKMVEEMMKQYGQQPH